MGPSGRMSADEADRAQKQAHPPPPHPDNRSKDKNGGFSAMFEQSLLELASTEKKRGWTVGVSIMIQAVILIALILVPLLTVEALPKTQLLGFLSAPPPPPPPPPPPAAAPMKVVKMVREFEDGHLTAPKEIPKQIAEIKEEDMPPPSAGGAGVVGGVFGGGVGGQLRSEERRVGKECRSRWS